jgi:hypothetical protein
VGARLALASHAEGPGFDSHHRQVEQEEEEEEEEEKHQQKQQHFLSFTPSESIYSVLNLNSSP